MNNVKNAPRASGPTPGRAPEYEDFYKAAEILRELERKGLADMAYEPATGKDASPTLVLQLDPEAAGLPLAEEFRQILNLAQTQNRYPIVYAQVQHVRPKVSSRCSLCRSEGSNNRKLRSNAF